MGSSVGRGPAHLDVTAGAPCLLLVPALHRPAGLSASAPRGLGRGGTDWSERVAESCHTYSSKLVLV